VGLLVAANGGERRGLSVDGLRVGRFLDLPEPEGERPRSVFAVAATDAPLLSGQLDRLAGRTALGLARGGFLDGHVREGLVLAFSTRNALVDGGEAVQRVGMVGEEGLTPLFEASGEAAEEAGLNGLLAAAPTERLPALTPERLLEAMRAAKTH
jgi:D-aminopeptidase